VEGNPGAIHSGDTIYPGSLLLSGRAAGEHSITILLPDGQRILYECFSVSDCERGFRVPALYRKPDPFAVDMLARIHAVLMRESQDASLARGIARPARDEALAVIGLDRRVRIQGLAGSMSNDRYTYDLRPLDRIHARQTRIALEKQAPYISLPVPSSGIYDLMIADELNNPRIDLFLAAVNTATGSRLGPLFRRAKATMEDWNGDYQGWPVHDFQRAYLKSLVDDIEPLRTPGPTAPPTHARNPEATDEPVFSPTPGVFHDDTSVTLLCTTPGAEIHFTVDGSQPFTTSEVYRAPIMVKGTELTIKAFARSPGRKDSAVVTGIFRIGED